MVMKRNMMAKNLRQSIFRSFGRFLAIGIIIALGAGIFVGLRATKSDMVATGQEYTDRQNMFDLRLLSSYGWGREQVEQVAGLDGVAEAEGVFYTDLIVSSPDRDDGVYRFYTIPEKINQLSLQCGRMPEAPDECLADSHLNGESVLGTTITVTDGNDADALEQLNCRTFTIVGCVSTPLYMDTTRGSTSVGSGSIANFYFVPAEAFDVDYYTEIHVTIPGNYEIYTEEYNDALKAAADALKPQLAPLAQERLEQVRTDARKQFQKGLREFRDGCGTYAEEKEKAEEELRKGYQELLDAEDALRRAQFRLQDGEKQIADARVMIEETRKKLRDSRKQLANSKVSAYQQLSDAGLKLMESYRTVTSNLQQVNAALAEISAKSSELNAAIIQLQTVLAAENAGIQAGQLALDYAKQFGASEETVQKLQDALDEATASRDTHAAQLEEAQAGKAELDAKAAELRETQSQLESAKEQIDEGMLELTQNQTMMEKQFAAAESQIATGEQQLDDYEEQLPEREQEIADGWKEYEQGLADYHEGLKTYRDGKTEALQKLADGEKELDDARIRLEDARKTIEGMTKNEPMVLDRNSNVGYTALDSNSNIVEGVSQVFPVFFLLVAALVCITTMTRMVDEERTQIGTLKALGYGNGAIISKYLIYAGCTAVFGCLLGTAVGSVVFPKILWEAYKLVVNVQPEICLKLDVPLCIGVFLMYTGAMLLVTWYCCRRSLREVPAELIRPKAPAAGKKLLLERLPFWKHLSFLNKVAARNVFRYRQRLAMMLLGIGGCTALLLTGFGIRDTIVRIADTQFQKVTLYDMEVYFREGRTPEQEAEFTEDLEPGERAMFFYQSSVELDGGSVTKDIYLIASDDTLKEYQNLSRKGEPVPFPGKNEAILSIGMAETLGIQVGDRVTLRDPDMRVLDVTVSGIYENYVYNYAIVDTATLEDQWGEAPLNQMAYVALPEGTDAYAVGARLNGVDGVTNVSVNRELAAMVGSMMDALDLVVVVVVICAGLLAVVVLYNLTNININERLREIATIKVLGFTARETGMYVFKENLVLCAMGTVLGLGMGKLLLAFVVDKIRVDLVWFQPRLLPLSYLWAVILTMLIAVLVDLFFYRRLDKINMAEALKSVE